MIIECSNCRVSNIARERLDKKGNVIFICTHCLHEFDPTEPLEDLSALVCDANEWPEDFPEGAA